MGRKTAKSRPEPGDSDVSKHHHCCEPTMDAPHRTETFKMKKANEHSDHNDENNDPPIVDEQAGRSSHGPMWCTLEASTNEPARWLRSERDSAKPVIVRMHRFD